ncbi:bifunctional serine/threonine-protein kinase/universal stress protein [Noviherbaspirillum galbum]|uniref:Protein kinase n=1 Tax=Noviherbaspirillum galbum TaxID=2709383 RepID=A0A6B3SUU3_9BURK|nr:bifunctional serine/threonine-protein kinase/universal stress protein [Noviherbaspirillum galbum]NEX64291.1 protein kinase [Noviherbaspirillum galbum]
MHAVRLEPGLEIDDFVLEEKLHKGGMATLWRVRRKTAGPATSGAAGNADALLMKLPILGDHNDPAAIVGFEVEQMIMPKLTGIHVPRFIASGDFTAQPYIVMELISGSSLRARFDEAPLPMDEVVAIGTKVANALHDLHRQHVIHLDIKPSNVMFRKSGEAILVDFGLSRHDMMPDLLAEEFRLPLGTGPYIAPEQVLNIRNDPRSDLYALGVLMYHLATGERPLGNPTSIRGLRRRLWRDPLPPRAINPKVPPWLQEVILHCLEVHPDARYSTAAQIAFDLQNPEQITLTARADKARRDSLGVVMRRWFKSIGMEAMPEQSAVRQLARAPIIMVAIDIEHGSEALADTLRRTTLRILQTEPDARLACVTVQKTNRIGMDEVVDRHGQNIHVKHLAGLKHWARPLGLDPAKLTFHVLEAPDPAAAIIDYAAVNAVDHIVIGSRGSSALRRYLGSVSSQVVALADCTVTVVKSAGSA